MATYQDFSITFRARSGDRYPVSVRSQDEEADGAFELPIPLERIDELLLSVAAEVRSGGSEDRAVVRKSHEGPRDIDVPRDIGVKLFSALFADASVRDVYMRSLGRAQQSGAVLRLRLHMNLDDASVRPLASLPWELLHDPAERKNLVEWSATALVRSPNSRFRRPPPFTPPLRVLFVMANPGRDLNLARERKDIEARLDSRHLPIDAHFLENATFRSLERRLHESDFHIVHFMGHGACDDRGGLLLLERDDGAAGADPLQASEFARLLLSEDDVRLVVLNACRTAQSSQAADVDPYSGGVATALVIAGIPTVVAMQFPISDDGAVDFADRLYSTIVRGETIEAAVREGRRAIRHEWPIPVLFSRCDGALFPSLSAPASPPASAPASVMVSPALDPGSSGEPDLRAELLPYMVDRTEVRFQLEQALCVQDASPSEPLVAIIHGDDAQCQDRLQQRLCSVELPDLLNLAERDVKISPYQLVWPERCRGRTDLHARLTSELARRIRPRASTDEMQRYFAALSGPVMVHSTVLSSEWQQYGDSVLDDYLAYWQGWPSAVASQRLLVFLFIKYQLPEAGWLRGRRARKTNDDIATALAALTRKAVDGIVLTVLPRLGGIRQQDVVAWNADHGYPLAGEDIKQIYREHGGDEQELSMQTVGRVLRELLAGRTHTTRGVR